MKNQIVKGLSFLPDILSSFSSSAPIEGFKEMIASCCRLVVKKKAEINIQKGLKSSNRRYQWNLSLIYTMAANPAQHLVLISCLHHGHRTVMETLPAKPSSSVDESTASGLDMAS